MQFRLSTLFLLAVVLWSSLAVFGSGWGVAVFVGVVVLAICVQNMGPISIDRNGMITLLVVIVVIGILIGLLLPAVQSARESAPCAQCSNNMHNITLALLNYEAKFHSFPPAYVADKNGRPMHSWRVLILPFLEYDDLYKQYNFNEPWDGPNNRKLLAARRAHMLVLPTRTSHRPVRAKRAMSPSSARRRRGWEINRGSFPIFRHARQQFYWWKQRMPALPGRSRGIFPSTRSSPPLLDRPS